MLSAASTSERAPSAPQIQSNKTVSAHRNQFEIGNFILSSYEQLQWKAAMKVYIQFIHLIFYFLLLLFMLAQFLRAVAYQTDHGREERERERENEPRNGIIYIIEKNFPSSIDRSGCSLASTIYGACQHISRDRLNRLLIHSYLTYASFCRRKIMAD